MALLTQISREVAQYLARISLFAYVIIGVRRGSDTR